MVLSDFRAQENKVCCYLPFFPFLFEMIGADATILVFLILTFKPVFSLTFTLIKMLFSFSSFSVLRVASSGYRVILRIIF